MCGMRMLTCVKASALQACGLSFSAARLLPMGSHPRVADKRSTYDLFGPVSKLWSANYDRCAA